MMMEPHAHASLLLPLIRNNKAAEGMNVKQNKKKKTAPNGQIETEGKCCSFDRDELFGGGYHRPRRYIKPWQSSGLYRWTSSFSRPRIHLGAVPL